MAPPKSPSRFTSTPHPDSEPMEEEESSAQTNHRSWADMNQDVLSLIFCKLGIPDLIAGVPFVCSSWRVTTHNPLSWKDLDFRNWDSISQRLHYCHRDDFVDFTDLLKFCILRSDGCVDSIYFPDFADVDDLLYVVERCPSLLYFSLESEEIHHDSFCEAISELQFLKGMAVHESLISREVLQHVRKCCSYFSELKIRVESFYQEEASAICECLPHLRKLEIPECGMHRGAILTLLDGLKELEYFDISGRLSTGITSAVLEKASRLKVFLWDSLYDDGEFSYCSDCAEDYHYQHPCECVENKQIEEQIDEWIVTDGHYPDDECWQGSMKVMSTSGNSSYCRGDGHVRFCGEMSHLKTSWSQANLGRRYYNCPSFSNGCAYFRWHDPEMENDGKEFCNKMIEKSRRLKIEVNVLKRNQRVSQIAFFVLGLILGIFGTIVCLSVMK